MTRDTPAILRDERREAWRRQVLAGFGLLLLLSPISPQAAAQPAIPKPAAGDWAPTAVGLLRQGHGRCAGVADRVLTYWRGLSGGTGDQESLDRYVYSRTTADIAGARKALDLAYDLLPQARREIDPIRGSVLERLHQAETDLCSLVAQPEAPIRSFEEQLDVARQSIEAIESELGQVLTLPGQQDLLRLVKPYLEIINAAADEADSKVRQDLGTLKTPPPAPPTDQELMNAWHKHYSETALSAKVALRDYVVARQNNDSTAIQTACRSLLDHVIPILNDGTAFKAPDPDIEEPLILVYRWMRRLGAQCTAGRFDETDEAYDKLQEHLSRAATALAPYGLQP